MTKYQKPFGFFRSLTLAWRGLIYSWKTQGHLKFHVVAALLVVAAAWWVRLSRWEWVLLVYAIGSVITTEVMNTAIELVVDLAQPKFHPLAGMAKDVAAGAVLVTAFQAVVIGFILFWPYLWHWMEQLR